MTYYIYIYIYIMDPQIWKKYLKMFNISDKVINFIMKAMENWKGLLAAAAAVVAAEK